MKEQDQCCKNCKWFEINMARTDNRVTAYGRKLRQGISLCRKFPPAAGGKWLAHSENVWCGWWEERA